MWKSRAEAGLTRYWSGSLFPFTERELGEWGISRAELDECYSWVAGEVGLSEADDGLNRYFGQSYATLPALDPTYLIERLVAKVHSSDAARNVGAVAGLNRVAI